MFDPELIRKVEERNAAYFASLSDEEKARHLARLEADKRREEELAKNPPPPREWPSWYNNKPIGLDEDYKPFPLDD
ncbi:hypothetical protein LWC34_35005 [Kibdelosporangium philippinense]|uniref:Uncharacterized protein n=1 Tax=Kibdelosporangium philippinense TaxID=211113 RepID=A0ABS8ZJM7_9PSEU|nr:hypothetical protein [Kibdelosporangium philippinense]MCE7007994.1 hypothetical protein [Kibdelosporangium philippinense]